MSETESAKAVFSPTDVDSPIHIVSLALLASLDGDHRPSGTAVIIAPHLAVTEALSSTRRAGFVAWFAHPFLHQMVPPRSNMPPMSRCYGPPSRYRLTTCTAILRSPRRIRFGISHIAVAGA